MMTNPPALAAALAALPVLLSMSLAQQAVPTTPTGIYLEAVRHVGSSTTDAVVITVTNARTHVRAAACVDVDTLAWAIAHDRGEALDRGNVAAIQGEMRHHTDRRFTFRSPEVLALFGFNGHPMGEDGALCDVIQSGRYAFRVDRTGMLIVGQRYDAPEQ